jgi:hypothetical protein
MGLGWVSGGSPYRTGELQAFQHMDCEELQGQQRDIGVIICTGPMVSPPGKCIGFAHRLTGSVMEEVEAGEIE